MTRAPHKRSESALKKAAEGVGLAFGSTLAFGLIVSVIFWMTNIDVFESAGKDAGWVGLFYFLYILVLLFSSFVAHCALFSVALPLLYQFRRDIGAGPLKLVLPTVLGAIGVFLIWTLLVVVWGGSVGIGLSGMMSYYAVAGIVMIVVTVPTSVWFLRRINADLRELAPSHRSIGSLPRQRDAARTDLWN